MVFGSIEKQDDSPGLWLTEAFSTPPLKPFNRIQILNRKEDLNVFNQVCVFRADPKYKMVGWGILDFFSEVAEWISTKLDRKQDLNVL